MKWDFGKNGHHKILSNIRAMNKSIKNDELWRGRFEAHEVSVNFFPFEDGSGGIVSSIIELRDKKTGKYEYAHVDSYTQPWHFFSMMNKFIVDDVNVWKENPRPSLNDKIDYTKIEWNPKENLAESRGIRDVQYF